MDRHILIVFSQNSPGVLSRIAGLLRRKLFNIDSLTVGPTKNSAVSQFTIVITGEKSNAQKAVCMIQNVVEVLSVTLCDPDSLWIREVVLTRVEIKNEAQYHQLLSDEKRILSREIFRDEREVIIELVDTSHQLDSFLARLQKHKIHVIDWVRSGIIAMQKSS